MDKYIYKGCSVHQYNFQVGEKITQFVYKSVRRKREWKGGWHTAQTQLLNTLNTERMKKQTHRVAVYHSYCTHITFTGERGRFTEWHHGKYSASLKIMEWLHGDITKRNVRMMRSDTNSWQLRLTKKCLGYMFHEITFFKIFYFCN